jgi:formylmethanofuran dehydrogenase subunit C
MRAITIRPLLSSPIPVEAERISPDVLAPLSLEDIGALEVWHGNRRRRLSDLFQVSGDDFPAKPEDVVIRLEGDFSRVKRVGEGMSSGLIEVSGDVGMHAGNNMRGGSMRITRNAGDWLGREMRGGEITVQGNAGNYAGAGYRGERCGMRGGSITVYGSAGLYLGEHLCGGSIKVLGSAGDFPGAANQGGTIFIGGSTYLPGAEMAKGTIIVKGSAQILPSFALQGEVEMEGIAYRKYLGDLVDGGKGELYVGQQSG